MLAGNYAADLKCRSFPSRICTVTYQAFDIRYANTRLGHNDDCVIVVVFCLNFLSQWTIILWRWIQLWAASESTDKLCTIRSATANGSCVSIRLWWNSKQEFGNAGVPPLLMGIWLTP